MQNENWFVNGSLIPISAGSVLPFAVATLFCLTKEDSITADLHELSTGDCGTKVMELLLLSPVPLDFTLIKLAAERKVLESKLET